MQNRRVNDVLPIFDEPINRDQGTPAAAIPMTPLQRESIRRAFAALGIEDAPSQFDTIEQLTGHRIASVRDVTFESAATLLPMLTARVASRERILTGNAWSDRTEETWIDKL